MGRKQKPTALKLIQGNPGRRPINRDEPRPKASTVRCPAWLKGDARKEWQRLAPELKRLGLLTVVDRTQLALYCQAYAIYLQAQRELEDLVVETTKGGWMQSQYLGIMNKQVDKMVKIASSFGLDPAARAALKADNPDKQGNYDTWRKGRGGAA